jgi:hypothetical protein
VHSQANCHTLERAAASNMAERRATSSELYAMSKHLAVQCAAAEVAYLNCKDNYNHPEDCLKEAKAVIKCSENLCAGCCAVQHCLPCPAVPCRAALCPPLTPARSHSLYLLCILFPITAFFLSKAVGAL